MREEVFEFETRESGDTAVVRLAGELDLAEVSPPLTLVPGPPSVQRLLEITGTEQQFTFAKTRGEPAS